MCALFFGHRFFVVATAGLLMLGHGCPLALPAVVQGQSPSLGTFWATVPTAMSSATHHTGDAITLVLEEDAQASAQTGGYVLPRHSTLLGRICWQRLPGRLGRSGQLAILIDTLRLPDGRQWPMRGHVAPDSLRAEPIQQRWLKNSAKTGVGAVVGSMLGTAFAGGSIQKPGWGAWIGASAGGALGLFLAWLGPGPDIVLQAGDQVEVELERSLPNVLVTPPEAQPQTRPQPEASSPL
jgi:hypothetical protein